MEIDTVGSCSIENLEARRQVYRNACLWIGSCPNEKDNRDFRNDSRDDTKKVRSAETKDKLGEDPVFAVNRKKYRIDGIEGIGGGGTA
ncbi:hypothetical protein EV426DRAFT_711946 [Tirmania nivea]|nr:hypothetical protein EV426DRAFT_711946 [Tirmania nivea]